MSLQTRQWNPELYNLPFAQLMRRLFSGYAVESGFAAFKAFS